MNCMQKQIKGLIAQALDMDGEKKSISEKMVAYYNAEGGDTLNTFQFHPQTMNFEIIDRKLFAEVLYPKDIYDLIDFHVRECVKREMKMRVCKNCLRYFAVTGKASTEYCNRVCDSKGRTCREIGAIHTWTQRKQGDEVFKEYRREYKKRFARINAGRLARSAFYAWSEEARKKKRGLRQRRNHTEGVFPLAEGVLRKRCRYDLLRFGNERPVFCRLAAHRALVIIVVRF